MSPQEQVQVPELHLPTWRPPGWLTTITDICSHELHLNHVLRVNWWSCFQWFRWTSHATRLISLHDGFSRLSPAWRLLAAVAGWRSVNGLFRAIWPSVKTKDKHLQAPTLNTQLTIPFRSQAGKWAESSLKLILFFRLCHQGDAKLKSAETKVWIKCLQTTNYCNRVLDSLSLAIYPHVSHFLISTPSSFLFLLSAAITEQPHPFHPSIIKIDLPPDAAWAPLFLSQMFIWYFSSVQMLPSLSPGCIQGRSLN